MDYIKLDKKKRPTTISATKPVCIFMVKDVIFKKGNY